MAECAILQSIRPVMAEDWFLPVFCVRAIIWYCVQLCAHGWKIPAHGAEMQPEMLGGDSYFQYEEDQPLRQRTPCCAQRPEGEYEQQPPGTSACPPVRTGTGGAAGTPRKEKASAPAVHWPDHCHPALSGRDGRQPAGCGCRLLRGAGHGQ